MAIRRWDKSKPPTGPWVLNEDSPAAQGLVGWWPMVGGASYVPDLSGKAHMVGSNGGLSLGSVGEPVIVADGTSTAYVSSAVAVTAAPLTLCGWVKFTSVAGNTALIALTTSSSSHRYLLYNASGGFASFAAVAGGVGQTQKSGLVANQWYHLAGVEFTSASRNVYVDAVAGSADTASIVPSGINETSVAADRTSGAPSSRLNGQLGACSVYNIAADSTLRTRLADRSLRFELMYPLRSRKWMVPAAGGGSVFNPYFYQHIAGTGV